MSRAYLFATRVLSLPVEPDGFKGYQMKISLRLAAAAFLLGAVPAAASAQASAPRTGNPAPAAAAPAPVQQELPAAPRTEPLPAAPSTISDPAVATIADGPPSNAQVLESTVARTAPTPSIGQPDGRMGFQDQVTPIGEEAAWFHDVILVPLIVAISLLVLVLLLWVIVRYRRSANPIPSRTSHNTLIEVIWTLLPVLILVAIAVPLDQAARQSVQPAQGRFNRQGDRQPMVLDLFLSG
jgi:cytochrome c oxidase subunit 2